MLKAFSGLNTAKPVGAGNPFDPGTYKRAAIESCVYKPSENPKTAGKEYVIFNFRTQEGAKRDWLVEIAVNKFGLADLKKVLAALGGFTPEELEEVSEDIMSAAVEEDNPLCDMVLDVKVEAQSFTDKRTGQERTDGRRVTFDPDLEAMPAQRKKLLEIAAKGKAEREELAAQPAPPGFEWSADRKSLVPIKKRA